MTDPVDDLIRNQMRDAFPQENEPSTILDELRPRMVRARRQRRALQTTAGIATLGAVLIGVLLVLPTIGGAPSELEVAGPDGSSTIVQPDDAKAAESPATTSLPGSTIEDSSQDGTDVAPSTPSQAPTTTQATTSSQATMTTQVTTTTQATTTSAPTTSSPPPPGLVVTPCGSLVAEIVGSGIGLVSTDPNPGFDVDVKSPGPTQIEVSFEDEADSHCEVIVENRDGQIWSDVDEEHQ